MLSQFCKYFFTYIFKAKTRQRLLFLAVFGLFLSSFALLVLQSTMGGLQNKLITRSKDVTGKGVIFLHKKDNDFVNKVLNFLESKNIKAYGEYEIELLLRHGNYISPVVVHGVDRNVEPPEFLGVSKLDELTIPRDLSYKLGLDYGSQVTLISPSHVDSLMGDIPRTATINIGNIIATDVPEIDLFHVWVRLPLIQNLIRAREMNRIRIYDSFDSSMLSKLLQDNFGKDAVLQTWEQRNSTLVWALGLETTVMVFLFIGMTMLVSLCITSGLMIFFGKVRGDLASFWILGSSRKNLDRASGIFLSLMSFLSVVAGIICGLIFLFLLDKYGFEIMPEVFVDRKIPIFITARGILVSFLVPFTISSLFSYFSLLQFKKDNNYLDHVRSIG